MTKHGTRVDKPEAASQKRRVKWIGIGVSTGLVLFSPFLIPDPAPPFDFLKRSNLNYIQVHSEPTGMIAHASYDVEGDPAAILQAARKELKGWSFGKDFTGSSEFTSNGHVVRVVDWNFGSEEGPITHVLSSRPARLIDHLRSPVHKISSWLP